MSFGDVSLLDGMLGRAPPPPALAAGRRIVVHDYGGHPFQVELSRWLAAQGAEVLHLYSADVEAPKGRLERHADDPPGFAVEPVTIGRPLDKYRFLRRWVQEMAYGRRLAARVAAFAPDVVLSANAPPAVQERLLRVTRRGGAALVCWVQDIFSAGVAEVLKDKPAVLRWPILRFLERSEFGTMRAADGLVVITADFLPVLARYGVRHPRSVVIENWAPAGELQARPKANHWAARHGLRDRFVFLCAGTLGMKHNPELLLALAREFRDDPEVAVVVVSQGLGRRFLDEAKARERLDNLLLFDYQPYDELPEVLGTADVAVVLLESFAGVLSVPSKVYSYFCARRPVLGAMPAANLARRLVMREDAGLCVDPGDLPAFLEAARRLRADGALRGRCADNQARYAAEAFAMDRIGPRFLDVFDRVPTPRRPG